MFKKNYIYFLLAAFSFGVFPSCVDDVELTQPVPNPEQEEPWVDPDIPEDMLQGHTISFTMKLEGVGGKDFASRAVTNNYLNDIDYFIDFEKVRILFFACADKDTTKYTDNNIDYYFDGRTDYFLFESKSRWVSVLSDYESSEQRWQVTAPVFTYGNNDDYPWDDIRYTLQNYPFKVVLLVNRPDNVNFGNFDQKFGDEDYVVEFHTDRGPNWGPDDCWLPPERRNTTLSDAEYNKTKPTINGLHHCQWDAVYSSKNNGDKKSGDAKGVYDFIMENPRIDPTADMDNGIFLPNPNDNPEVANDNLMGALSYWTERQDLEDGTQNTNAYFLPSRKQGIPMYGTQIFDPIPDSWKQGTPYNISYRPTGQSEIYHTRDIFLLRSLVKLELRIPKVLKDNNGRDVTITISQPRLRYSNVMARCEPLDVATPTERIWKTEDICEWEDIKKYGPIINSNSMAPGVDNFQRRMAWFYGAWKRWWHFNMQGKEGAKAGVNGLASESYFDLNSTGKGIRDYPHIYNPVIQRNADPRIDPCLVEDEDHYIYIVYTGERNINDPSTFGKSNSFYASNAEFAFFSFIVKRSDSNTQTEYFAPITDYRVNTTAKALNPTLNPRDNQTYRGDMGTGGESSWNWPLLRNHHYIFTVTNIGNISDPGGLDIEVISSENRSHDYWFN